MPALPAEYDSDVPDLPPCEQSEINECECEVDGDVPSCPSVEHCEQFTWRAAPSCLLPELEEGPGNQPPTFEPVVM